MNLDQINKGLTEDQILGNAVTTQAVDGDTFRDIVYAMFKPNDMVVIKNNAPYPSGFAYMHIDDEEHIQPNEYTNTTIRGAQRAFLIHAGEEKVVQGWLAYMALEHMWKEYAQYSSSDGARMLADVQARTKWLDEAYRGPAQYTTGVKDTAKEEAEKPARRGRQAKAESKDEDLGFSE